MLVGGHPPGHLGYRLLALDQDLVGDSEFLGEGENQVVIFITLIHVHADAVLAALQRLAEGADVQGVGGNAVRALETELLELIQGVIAYKALSGGAAVDRPVVREHENAVLGELEVELHYVSAHPDDGLDGRDGVLRIIAPVASVAGHDHIL